MRYPGKKCYFSSKFQSQMLDVHHSMTSKKFLIWEIILSELCIKVNVIKKTKHFYIYIYEGDSMNKGNFFEKRKIDFFYKCIV